jgi:subtilisin-like proprotein convertase family protein
MGSAFYYAYTLVKPWDFVSEPILITVVPDPLFTFFGNPEPDLQIPDGSTAGIEHTIHIDESIRFSKLVVHVDLYASMDGDITVELRHDDTGTTATLIDRIGYPQMPGGSTARGIYVNLDDDALEYIEDQDPGTGEPITGTYKPYPDQLATFIGENSEGGWTLIAKDVSTGEGSTLSAWGLTFYK